MTRAAFAVKLAFCPGRTYMQPRSLADLWFKNAIIYCIDVDTFQDGDGDGVGDFRGLCRRLDYLAGMGVTCIWLLPFFPSPDRDNGYDIIDYYNVDPQLGTLGDFTVFMREAEAHGIKVIIDLVVNHTSIDHPWFRSARSDRNSPYRDWYVWRKDEPPDTSHEVVFPGHQESIWSYVEETESWYLHRFFRHQPDLNIANAEVREELGRIMGFWLQLGVAGFRMDAAPFVIELKGPDRQADVPNPYDYLGEFREFLSWRRGDAILLAEANVSPKEITEYFGHGRRLHMIFNFLVNQHLMLALARETAEPLERVMNLLPAIPERTQWAQFVRNHDELDLGRLSAGERGDVFKKFAPRKEMRLYERGIRRRLPSMMNGERAQIELAYSIAFSLPGTPVLWYGEEIGMGDNLSLEGRCSVRTPMQWSEEPNAGFSTAPPGELVRPVISRGRFGYRKVNVRSQRRAGDSFLNWMERLIRLRKECSEWGWGTFELLETNQPQAVLAHSSRWGEGRLVALHNFSRRPVRVELDLSEPGKKAHWIDQMSADIFPASARQEIDLPPFGYRWLRRQPGNSRART